MYKRQVYVSCTDGRLHNEEEANPVLKNKDEMMRVVAMSGPSTYYLVPEATEIPCGFSDAKTSPASPSPRGEPVRQWMLDSGSGNDLIQESLARKMGATLRNHPSAPSLQTANGVVRPEHQVALNIKELDETIELLVLQSTPSVLSLGRRCMEEGYTFVWEVGENPVLITPSGNSIVLSVEGNIPYLLSSSPAAPAERTHGLFQPRRRVSCPLQARGPCFGAAQEQTRTRNW